MATSLLFLFFFSAALPLSAYATTAGGGGFYIDLIHRDSPRSPTYDPSLSHSERLLAAVRRSKIRLSYLTAAGATNSSFHSELVPNSYEYLMTINVGTPSTTIHAIADTGSDLTWTQCQPCTSCYDQSDPIFDPRKSSTYTTISCQDDVCTQLPDGGCGSQSLCQYHYSYGDRSYTDGVLSAETFSFDSEGRGKVTIPKVLFGCSHESNGTFKAEGGGLVGLGGGSLSLVSQLGSSIDHKFSYCLVPYSNTNNATSLLYFGDKYDFQGPNMKGTPIIAGETNTFYYLSLETISVGNSTVARRRPVTGSSSSSSEDVVEGNIIIDSGTTLTLLDDSMLTPVVTKLSNLVELPTVTDNDGLFPLCFDVSGQQNFDLDQLPTIEFGFQGAAVPLPPLNTFREIKEGVVCLMMASSSSFGGGISIFGNIAQQNFLVGYDLNAKMVYFEPKDCAQF